MTSLLKKLLPLFIVIAIAITASLSVSEKFEKQIAQTFQPEKKESWVGDYLAGFHAMQNNDYHKASNYFSDSIQNGKPDNYLQSKTLTLLLVSGKYDEAFDVASKIYKADESAISGLTLIVKNAGKGDFARAAQISEELKKAGQSTIIHQLVYAWTKLGEGNKLAAQDIIEKLHKTGSIPGLTSYHYALISELAGNDAKAEMLYRDIIKQNNYTNAIATAAYRFFDKQGDEKAKKEIASKFIDSENFLQYHKISNAKEGIAEAFLGVAGIIMHEYRSDKSAAFFRLALYLNADLQEAKMLLGTILTNEGDLYGANKVLEKIKPESYLKSYARLAIARNYRSMGDDQKAINAYKELLNQENSKLDALVSLGDIERSAKNWEEAVEYYSEAINDFESNLTKEEQKSGTPDLSRYWAVYFARGVAYERLKDWEKAEADMRKALEVQPDQPEVLNYLAYTWVDKETNLEEAKEMILKAHEQRPDDAHILDSVGWTYFKLGDLEKAEEYVEYSASIIPYDPTVNDHLGDIYWAIGRKTEAKYQWQRALENDPEEGKIAELKAKLEQSISQTAQSAEAENEVITDETESTR